MGFGSAPTDHEHLSSAVESKGMFFRALVAEPIVASAIPGRPQSINLAAGGQAACRFNLASATAINHRLASIEGDELASLPCPVDLPTYFVAVIAVTPCCIQDYVLPGISGPSCT